MDEMLKNLNGPWSNAACMGYCLIAMRRAGLRPTAQRRVLLAMEGVFDLGAGGSRPAGAAGGRGRASEVQGGEPEGHAACPGGCYGERQAAHRGRCRADVPAGRRAAGVYKARGRHHLQRVAVRRG